jgi:hypothetical protein
LQYLESSLGAPTVMAESIVTEILALYEKYEEC